jgi:hypothetical protein
MIRPASILLGPELYWIIVYAVVSWISARNVPSTPAGNQNLERLWWLLPLIAVPLTFAFCRVPGAGRWWMLLRIDIAAMVGLIACSLRCTSAIDYHDSRNSGTAAGFILAVSFGIIMLTAGNIVAAGLFWWRGRAGA